MGLSDGSGSSYSQVRSYVLCLSNSASCFLAQSLKSSLDLDWFMLREAFSFGLTLFLFFVLFFVGFLSSR